jgi:probable rRNA maturation factor
VIGETLDRLQVGDAEVHVLVAGDAQVRRLNHEYRGIDTPTDVLSFPDGDQLPSGRRFLGQIVVSLDAAQRQAAEFGHTELDELRLLALHGTIHLLGHDHDVDGGEMDDLELRLREEILG